MIYPQTVTAPRNEHKPGISQEKNVHVFTEFNVKALKLCACVQILKAYFFYVYILGEYSET